MQSMGCATGWHQMCQQVLMMYDLSQAGPAAMKAESARNCDKQEPLRSANAKYIR